MAGSYDVRPDAFAKAMGTAKYSGDYLQPDIYCAKVLWPEDAPIRITNIDCSEACKVEGVVRIITGEDVPGSNMIGLYDPFDRPILVKCGETARFMMDALAIVVAENEDAAEKALRLIRVDYEKLPGLYSIEDAVASGAEPYKQFGGDKGSPDEAFDSCAAVVEADFDLPWIEHTFLEPEAGFCYKDDHGVMILYFGTQNLARHHRCICKSLDIPYSSVRVISPYVGGAFGGKHELTLQVYMALICMYVGKPTKMIWTREESFRGGKRHSCKAKAKMGVDERGKIISWTVDASVAAGPYMAQTPQTLKPMISGCLGPYDIENYRIQGKAYKLNCLEAVAFRGFGWPEGTMMLETMLDQCARRLGLDLVEVHKINVLPREKWFTHYPYFKATLLSENTQMKTLQAALDAAGEKPSVPGKKVGRGICSAMCTFEFGNTPGYKGTGADLVMFCDGSIIARIGFPEIGQGITGVVISLISEFFSIPGTRIRIIQADNSVTPKAGSLGGSRGTYNIGKAVLDACDRLKQKLEQYAREMLHSEAEVSFRSGRLYQGDFEVASFEKLMDFCYYQGKDLCAHGWYEGDSPEELKAFTFISGVADVAVDERTGEVKVLQLTVCHDAGKVIYRDGALGQLIGGTVMAMGGVLYEEFKMRGAKPATPSLAEYIVPTAKDLPDTIKALFVEVPSEDGPQGAKGMGEHTQHIAPCIVNAVCDATGLFLTDFPITPEKILAGWGKI